MAKRKAKSENTKKTKKSSPRRAQSTRRKPSGKKVSKRIKLSMVGAYMAAAKRTGFTEKHVSAANAMYQKEFDEVKGGGGKGSLVKVRSETEGVVPAPAKAGGTNTGQKTRGTAAATLPEPKRMSIALDLIDDSAHGGRGKRSEQDDVEIKELAASIAGSALLQPVGLVELNGKAKGGKKYELVWGWRRVQAHKELDRKVIDAAVYPASCEDRVEELRAIENVQQEGWDTIEQALAVSAMYDKTLADETGNASHSARLRAVGAKLGKSESWVGDRVYLARLDGASRDLVKSGRLPLQQARAIATLADPVLRNEVARNSARQTDGSGGESYERVSRFCAEYRSSLKVVPWKLDVAFAGAPACDKCPSNTANDVGLFGHDPKEGKLVEEAGPLCMNKGCFEKKRRACETKIDAGVARVREAIKAKKLTKDDLNKTEMSAAGVMPDVVKEATFVRKVKNEITPQAPSVRKNQGLATSMTGGGKRETPAEISKRRSLERFEKERHQWFDDAETAVREACKTPARRAYLEMLHCWDVLQGAIGHNDTSRKKCQASPKLAMAISKLDAPTLADFEAIAPEKLAEFDDMLSGYDSRRMDESGVAMMMAKALGVTLAPYPKREEEAAETEEKPAGGKGKKAVAAAVGSDDAESDDDA